LFGAMAGQIRHPKKRAFLAAFPGCGNIRRACQAAGINRDTFYKWSEHDAEFVLAFQQAKVEAVEYLEAEAHRRATEGVRKEKPIYGRNGALLATVIETDYSDVLLIFLLKGLAPEKYRERVDVTQTQVVKTIDRDAYEAV